MTSLPLKIVKFTEYVILCDTSPELEFMLPLCSYLLLCHPVG